MNTLKMYPTEAADTLEFPDTAGVVLRLSSPALDIFTDFRKAEPLVVDIDTTVADARTVMLASHVHLLLVVDHAGHFRGALDMRDIEPQEILKRVSLGHDRADLTVRDFVRAPASLKAFSYEEVARASVADIIRALESSGEQHCLVIDRAHHRIRGIIAASAIAKKLRLPVNARRRSSFADIFDTIHWQRHEAGHRFRQRTWVTS